MIHGRDALEMVSSVCTGIVHPYRFKTEAVVTCCLSSVTVQRQAQVTQVCFIFTKSGRSEHLGEHMMY